MNWKDKHNLFFKLLRLHFGLALYSIGLTLGIQANIGLAHGKPLVSVFPMLQD